VREARESKKETRAVKNRGGGGERGKPGIKPMRKRNGGKKKRGLRYVKKKSGGERRGIVEEKNAGGGEGIILDQGGEKPVNKVRKEGEMRTCFPGK